MATTNFCFSEDEYLQLLKYILSKNCYLVSGIERDSPDDQRSIKAGVDYAKKNNFINNKK